MSDCNIVWVLWRVFHLGVGVDATRLQRVSSFQARNTILRFALTCGSETRKRKGWVATSNEVREAAVTEAVLSQT